MTSSAIPSPASWGLLRRNVRQDGDGQITGAAAELSIGDQRASPFNPAGESRTRLLQGIAIGAIATMFIGFYWGGWVTGGTAKRMASAAETNGQMWVPLCVAQFMAADGAVAKIKVTPSYSHDDVVREFVKTVAGTPMDYSFARGCAAAVDDTLAKSAAKS